ncbi:MAG: meso-butanediol dehydrogenase/(S,S)-butanediol dehydrogenase/diacetyl reductase [Arenicella sp.]|jgi:meso-butanediol dehydrogenase/(S,S)-butanediol dehydrogenase/diacetyl reductase
MILKDKVALITGAGQGIGQGIALAMADQGAKIAAAGRTLKKVEVSCELIEARGAEAIPILCDVKDRQSLQNCVQSVVDQFGGINILVNNAQEVPLGRLENVTDEEFTAGFQSGPQASLRLMQLCHPYLKGGGSIVNLATTAAKRWDTSNYGAYSAVKEAIRALTRAAASEWGCEGIRANVILPHASSPGMQWWMDSNPEEAAEFIASIPMQRIGDCEQDIGVFVATLCSDACAYVNGQSIAVDGGQANLG